MGWGEPHTMSAEAQRDGLVAEIDHLAASLPYMSAETWPFAIQNLIQRRRELVPDETTNGGRGASTPAPTTHGGTP